MKFRFNGEVSHYESDIYRFQISLFKEGDDGQFLGERTGGFLDLNYEYIPEDGRYRGALGHVILEFGRDQPSVSMKSESERVTAILTMDSGRIPDLRDYETGETIGYMQEFSVPSGFDPDDGYVTLTLTYDHEQTVDVFMDRFGETRDEIEAKIEEWRIPEENFRE